MKQSFEFIVTCHRTREHCTLTVWFHNLMRIIQVWIFARYRKYFKCKGYYLRKEGWKRYLTGSLKTVDFESFGSALRKPTTEL